MKSTVVSLFLFLILFLSCRQEVNKLDMLKTFVLEEFDEKELRSDEYFSEMRLLPLQLDTNQFIGKAKDVCIVGDTIFLLDEMTASIYTFDKKDGKCIAVICKRGNGPNEYVNPVALSVNSGSLYVLDMPTSRVIEFDMELNAVRSIQFDFPASDFVALNTGFLLYNLVPTKERNKFVYINDKGEYINSFISSEQEGYSNNLSGGLGKFFLKNRESDVFAFESYSDIVYEWKNESLEPVYRIAFGKLGMPTDIDKNKINLFKEPYAFSGNIFMLSDMFIPSFFYRSQRYYGFISLSGKVRDAGIVKDERYHIPFYPQWQQGNELIGICRYESAKKYFEENQIFVRSLDDEFEQEQPVLVFYTRQ